MIKKIIRKIIDRLFARKLDDIKIQKGILFEKQLEKNLKNIKNLDETYFKVFSQDTEDGIIQYLLKSLSITNVKFVEIGTQDYSESNTRYLLETMRCDGLIIDPYPKLEEKIKSFMKIWTNNLKIYNDYIEAKNINDVLEKYTFEKNLDFFSIDIDSIDYWVLKNLKPKISKILVLEYNPYFGPNKNICAPNIDSFDRFDYHYTGFCWGASLKAYIKLMANKGYTFLGTNRLNCNAFFILSELCEKISINIPNEEDLSKYTNVKFGVLKNLNGKLVNMDELKNEIDSVNVYDLDREKIVPYKET